MRDASTAKVSISLSRLCSDTPWLLLQGAALFPSSNNTSFHNHDRFIKDMDAYVTILRLVKQPLKLY